MAVPLETVTEAQVRQLEVLVPWDERGDDALSAVLADRTALVIQRDPATGEPLQGAYGVLRADVVDVYGVAAALWEERAYSLLGTDEAREVTSERNGDVSRGYGAGGGPMTHAKAMAVARRLWRRALGRPPAEAAKVVEVLPPLSQRGFTPGDPSTWPEPVYADPGEPAQLAAPYVVNRPEPGP